MYGESLVPPLGTYAFDPVHTFAEFVAQHLVVGHVRGRFDQATGSVTIAEDPTQSTVEVQIETASVSTHDARRDEDLRGPRFFDAATFPTLTFRSRKIVPELDGQWTVEGDLPIRDAMRPVLLSVRITGVLNDPAGKTRIGLHAETRISRREFGLTADLERESGGVAYGKDIAISVYAEATR